MTRMLLALALLAVAVVPTFAQSTFSWDPHDTLLMVDPDDLECAFGIEIANTTNEERVYMLEFLDDTPNNLDWSRSWCTHGFCYAPFFQQIPDTLGAMESDPDCHIQVGWLFLDYPEVPDTTLYINTRAYDEEFPNDYVETQFILIIGEGSNVDEGETTRPLEYSLAPVYPNPFNAQATVNFTLPAPGDATIALFDVMGREVQILSDGFHSAGTHQLSLNARDLPSGTYLLRLQAGQQQLAQRVTLVK